MPGKEEGKENEEEQEQREAGQQMGSPGPGGGAMKACQRVICLILLGFGVQVVKAEDQEFAMHLTIERDLYPDLHVESGDRWKRTQIL